MASKHRDIGLKFRHRSTPNTRRVTKDVGFGGGGTKDLGFRVSGSFLRLATHIQASCLFRCI